MTEQHQDSAPPRDPDLEACALGQILAFPVDVWPRYRDAGLRLGHFYRPPHQLIFDAITRLDADAAVPDVPLVLTRLRDEGHLDDVGPAFVTRLVDGVPRPAPANVVAITNRLGCLALARQLYYAGTQLAAAVAQKPNAVANNGLLARHRHLLQRAEEEFAPGATDVSETLAALVARLGTANARATLIGDLVAARETCLIAGEERALKSWIICEFATALATGTPALGVLPVVGPGAVLLVTNEDAPQRISGRLQQLLLGRGVKTLPETIRLLVGRGCSLDDPSWRQRLFAEIRAHGVRAVFFDPLRSVTACSDQGPAEWRAAGDFLRRLATETDAAVGVAHHVTKPPLGGDARRRLARVSGGGIVATIDAPILAERVDSTSAVLIPDSYKHGPTPPPLHVRLTVEGELARLSCAVTTAAVGTDLALQAKIVDFVRAAGETSGTKIAQGLHHDKAVVLRALHVLAETGTLDSTPGARGARLWFVP